MSPRKLRIINFLIERFLLLRTWGFKAKIRKISGVKTLFLNSKQGFSPVTIFYVHGGAYVFKLTPKHLRFLKHLAREIPVRFVVPLFEVVPKITIEELNFQIQKVLENTFKESELHNFLLLLMGDSAGGGSILWLFSRLDFLQNNPRVKLCLISPFVRAFFTLEEVRQGAEDPVINPQDLIAWKNYINTDVKNPQLNVLLLDSLKLTGQDVFLWYGGKELLFQQIEELKAKMIKEKANLTTVFHSTGFHVQPFFSQETLNFFTLKLKKWLSFKSF